MANYTFNKTYDIEEIYAHADIDSDGLQLLNDRHIVKYRTKTIKSGDILECEIYPIWDTRSSMSRAKSTKESREAQKRLNYKNAIKTAVRLVNTNFTDNDYWATFTYDEKHLPKSVEDAEKLLQKFIRRLRCYARAHNYPDLKYFYTTEFNDSPDKPKIRVHHNVIFNFPNRDIAEELWRNGGRNSIRRLVADKDGYEGLVRYIMKDPRGAKRYVTSKNFVKPQITVADCKLTRRRVWRLVAGDVEPSTVFEPMYKNGYYLTRFSAKTSDYVTGAYLYARMYKKRE